MSNLTETIKSLPTSPGVYIFRSKTGEILYVGKATSLKDRVSSYFQNKGGAVRPIEIFIAEVVDIEIKKADTVLEAYILEQDMIKRMQPKYNAMGKDDKSFVYVVVTKEDFPRFLVLRKTDLETVDREARNVKRENNKKELNVSRFKFYVSRIYGPYTSRRQIELALKILRKIFPYHSRLEHAERGCLDSEIGLCPAPYDGKISQEEYLRNIHGIEMILKGRKSKLLKELELEMNACSENEDYECAADLRNQIFALKHIRDVAMITENNEQRTMNNRINNNGFMRIEAYDISNISGTSAVGSMVVFDNSDVETQNIASLQPNKSQYRKFRIKTIEGANDVGAMEEVLRRRFKNNWKLPNLLILDGGRGHLNMARRVLRINRLEIPLLAVAKGPTRKKLDFYTFGNVPEVSKEIIEQMRDEAHRFAITYHRKVRRGEMLN